MDDLDLHGEPGAEHRPDEHETPSESTPVEPAGLGDAPEYESAVGRDEAVSVFEASTFGEPGPGAGDGIHPEPTRETERLGDTRWDDVRGGVMLEEAARVEIEPEPTGRSGGSLLRWLLETLVTIAAAVALALFLQAYVVKTYVVPTGSMVPTIQLEDRIISNRLAYRFGNLEIGDVIVLENPTHDGPPLVKRAIALGGQEIDIRDGIVYIDGEKLDEPWVQPARRGKESLAQPVVVPVDQVFVMGDNRVGSSDSRVFGTVPVDTVFGQAFFTYWPPRSFGVLE